MRGVPYAFLGRKTAVNTNSITINGKPTLIIAGEIHYFRLAPNTWEDRILKLKAAGANTVSTYVPWLCHEPEAGKFDFGEINSWYDLESFIQLCEKNGMYFIVRPGPFIMAEMKNEGLPYWLYDRYPEAIPVGWKGRKSPTATLDYLSPGYLESVQRWYGKIGSIVKSHLISQGGNIIAVQLDNEVGMLSWVSNTPDFTNHFCAGFKQWLQRTYDDKGLISRYGFSPEKMQGLTWMTNPAEKYANALRLDVSQYSRQRYAQYIAILREYAQLAGMTQVPFIVNVHGTGGGRGYTFPIGISQLTDAFTQGTDIIPGTDIYFGDLKVSNFSDLYLINEFMKAVKKDGQSLGSMEFNCGDGDFGDNLGERLSVSAADLKARLCVAQDNKFLNYYLFAGGSNPELANPVHDGNDRIAITGEKHGFAAPVSPNGKLNYTLQRTAESIQTMQAVAPQLAVAQEEYDGVSFGYISDYYVTEFCPPNSHASREMIENITRYRDGDGWNLAAKSLLLMNYRFNAIDLRRQVIAPKENPALVLSLAEYLSRDLQEKLVKYLHDGGKLFIFGMLPRYDELGHSCTVLIDAMGLSYVKTQKDSVHYYLSVVGHGMAADTPEIRTNYTQLFTQRTGETLFTEKESDLSCGAQVDVGGGTVFFLTAAYHSDFNFYRTLFERQGIYPHFRTDFDDIGILMLTSKMQKGRIIHLLNLDDFTKRFHILNDKQHLLDGNEVTLAPQRGLILLQECLIGDTMIRWATGELFQAKPGELVFRCFGEHLVIKLAGQKNISAIEPYEVSYVGSDTVVRVVPDNSLAHLRVSERQNEKRDNDEV
jgi:beta-galactosidase